MNENGIYGTTNLAVAAYLKMMGLPIQGTTKDPVTGRVTFEFEDVNGVAEHLQIEYHNSECAKFYNELYGLKKLIFAS